MNQHERIMREQAVKDCAESAEDAAIISKLKKSKKAYRAFQNEAAARANARAENARKILAAAQSAGNEEI